jgi:hypothetical protein
MSIYSHQTASAQFVEAAGMRFAYRRFANTRGTGDIWSQVRSSRRVVASCPTPDHFWSVENNLYPHCAGKHHI